MSTVYKFSVGVCVIIFLMSIWELGDLCTPWCIHVVVTLRIAEHISQGLEEIGPLSAAAGADRDSLHRVLRHLVTKGVFAEPERGRFILNEEARGLLEPGIRLGFDLDGFGSRMAYAWGSMLSAVRTGRPAYHEVFGKPFWEDLRANPNIRAQFNALMGQQGHGIPDWRVLPNPADWVSVKTVVDVGGGTGLLLAEILRAQTHLRGILVDLPDTVSESAEIFQNAGVTARVATEGQSFFDPLPAGADVYLLSKVLDDWADAEALAILKRCAEAARPNGRVIVLGGPGPGEEPSPELLMMVLVGGKGRSLDQLTGMAGEAGLTVTGVGRQESGKQLVQFQPS
jgi:2,7-dihydroxy-5-methyl-1-naphthoate 7-O-methyltransferase